MQCLLLSLWSTITNIPHSFLWSRRWLDQGSFVQRFYLNSMSWVFRVLRLLCNANMRFRHFPSFIALTILTSTAVRIWKSINETTYLAQGLCTIVQWRMQDVPLASVLTQKYDRTVRKKATIGHRVQIIQNPLYLYNCKASRSIFCDSESMSVSGTYLKRLGVAKERIPNQHWNWSWVHDSK